MSASVEVKSVPRPKVLGVRALAASILVAGAMVGGIAIGRSTVQAPRSTAVERSAPDWAASARAAGFTGRLGFTTGAARSGEFGGYTRAQLIHLGYTGRLGFTTNGNG